VPTRAGTRSDKSPPRLPPCHHPPTARDASAIRRFRSPGVHTLTSRMVAPPLSLLSALEDSLGRHVPVHGRAAAATAATTAAASTAAAASASACYAYKQDRATARSVTAVCDEPALAGGGAQSSPVPSDVPVPLGGAHYSYNFDQRYQRGVAAASVAAAAADAAARAAAAAAAVAARCAAIPLPPRATVRLPANGLPPGVRPFASDHPPAGFAVPGSVSVHGYVRHLSLQPLRSPPGGAATPVAPSVVERCLGGTTAATPLCGEAAVAGSASAVLPHWGAAAIAGGAAAVLPPCGAAARAGDAAAARLARGVAAPAGDAAAVFPHWGAAAIAGGAAVVLPPCGAAAPAGDAAAALLADGAAAPAGDAAATLPPCGTEASAGDTGAVFRWGTALTADAPASDLPFSCAAANPILGAAADAAHLGDAVSKAVGDAAGPAAAGGAAADRAVATTDETEPARPVEHATDQPVGPQSQHPRGPACGAARSHVAHQAERAQLCVLQAGNAGAPAGGAGGSA